MLSFNRKATGDLYESRALKQLESEGLTLIEKNFSCKPGEIDLIMRDKKTTVFIEVRYRKNQSHSSAEESIDTTKQSRIIRASQHWLLKNKAYQHTTMRFDAVCFNANNDNGNWIKGAFSL